MKVTSDSLWPHGLYSSWNSPGQNTGVGRLSLLQGSNPGLLHCRWILYQLSHKGNPSILERVAYPFSSRAAFWRTEQMSKQTDDWEPISDFWGKKSIWNRERLTWNERCQHLHTCTRRTATPVTVRTMSGFSTPRTQDSVESVDPAHSKINPGSYCARKQGFILRERLGGEGKALLTAERQLLNIKGMIKKVTLLPSWQW